MKLVRVGLASLLFCNAPSTAAGQTALRPGDPALDPTRLLLGTDTVHLTWEADGREQAGPMQIEELAIEWSGTQKMLRQVMTVESDGHRRISDTTWYDFDTLTPIAHHSLAAQRRLVLEYRPDAVSGFSESEEGERTAVSVELTQPIFDPSESILVLRSLPLRVGFVVDLPVLDHATGAIRWSRARVTRRTEVSVGGTTVPVWEVSSHISDDRPDVTYWFSERDHRLLMVEAPLGQGRVMRGAVSAPTVPADPERMIQRGLAALGGEAALCAVHSVSVSGIGHQYLIEQSERPAGPWIALYEEREALSDLRGLRVRASLRTRFVQFPDWTPWRTIIADTGAAAFVFGDRQGPAQVANALEAAWTLELDPLRIWITAREAPDVRVAGDTVLQDVPHAIVTFTWRDRPVRVFVNAHTWMPTAIAVRAPELHGHGSVWGDAWVTRWFSTWSLEAGGVRYPRQRDVYFEHYPWQSFTATNVVMNVETPADSFGIARDTRDAFAAASATGGLRDMQLGQMFGGRDSEPVALPGGTVVLPGAWYATLVPVDEDLIVLEAPISPEYSAQVIAEARRRFPGRHITAVISTSDAWPHVGGVRGYVATGVPVYAVDVNIPLLERLVRQPWTAAPDALERNPRSPQFRPVQQKTRLGSGDDAMELYPIRSESGERMLMVYWSAHRLLYAADLIQQQRDGSFFWPLYLREVADAVEREGLDVETVFAMHLSPTPWTAIMEALQ